MKSFLIFCLGLLTAGIAHSQHDPGLVSCEPPGYSISLFKPKRELPAGALVMMETNGELESGRLTPGQFISLRSITTVWVKSEIVIASGATAIARIKTVFPASANEPERFVVEAMSVQAVDGQEVPLTGEMTFRGRYPNENFTVAAATLLTAHVSKDLNIKV